MRSKLILERVSCLAIAFVIPLICIYHLTIIRARLLDIFNVGLVCHYFHLLLFTYVCTNMLGNLFLAIVNDSRLQIFNGEGRYCETCKKTWPTESWHCSRCNACILDRDHHCFFLSRCIGRYNMRYFICFLIHLVISMVYTLFIDYFVLVSEFGLSGLTEVSLSAVRILLPVYTIPNPFEMLKHLCAFIWFFNLGILFFCSRLLWYYMNNTLKGVTCYENKIGKFPLKSNWKVNMTYVFGEKWYLALLWPFVSSTLPYKNRI